MTTMDTIKVSRLCYNGLEVHVYIYISTYKPSLLIITNSFSIILTCLLFDFKISEGCSEGMFLLLLFTGNICRKKSLDQKSMKIVLVSHPSVNPRKTWRPFKLIIEGVH